MIIVSEEFLTVEGTPLVLERCYPFRVAFLNDLHVGCVFGMFPEKWTDHYGKPEFPNTGQVALREYLMEDFAEQCRENQVNHLWIAGDVVAGQNRGERGKFISIIELGEQTRAAAQVIADFVNEVPSIEKILIWKGTGYHGSFDSSVEEDVVGWLYRDHDIRADYRGEYSYINLRYGDYDKKIWITHTASGATMYPEQAMGKDMMLWQEAVGQGKLPAVDMIIRAHKHSFIEVHKPSIRATQLPCWQFFVPYDRALQNYSRWQPDIGGVIMLFDDKMRTTVWHFTYDNIIEPGRFINVNIRGVERRSLLRR